ncbi:MAG: right-handed parallel beta-helix repeat-containing protein, partial [Methanosarcinales archaeon]|nr:right-handed parallel beta-helix repeat-containing protein [Methanosarcinales archaeon]
SDAEGNTGWNNSTAYTATPPHLHHINVTPTSYTLNISEEARFYATGYDRYNNSISGLTFRWYLNSSGIGMLNRTDGSAVNFTALHAGITEIYAVNGSISSNKTYTVEITVNTTHGTGFVTNGTGNATSGNSTMIVSLANTSVVGTINIVEIDDPLNCTDDSGNRTGLGTDVELIKGVNITVDESIAEAMAIDASNSSYVHVRIGYNESELGDIDESTLHIYKFESGPGWLRMNETENPKYCSSNGRNTTANYVWANVTSCSPFVMASDGPSATSDSTPPAIQSWWNNRTGNDSLDLSVNTTEPVEFGVVFNQTGNITWNATGHTNVTNTSVNSGNQTFSWDVPGSNYLNVSITNDNGTSETLRWNITVTAPPTGPDPSQAMFVNETGWWFEHGQFNQSSAPIQSAVDNATDGTYIFVYNGSYIENVVIDKLVTLEGEGMDVVDVSPKISGNIFTIESSWVNISSFTIKSSLSSGIYLNSANNCNISWNNLSDNHYGIRLDGSNYNNISNNTANNNNARGIYLHDHSDNNTVIDNVVEHNDVFGIYIDGCSNGNTVQTNVIKDNKYGIEVNGAYSNSIYNNYILFNVEFDAMDRTGQNAWNITKTPGRNILNDSYLGGNYYSDYTGSDSDSDGLGDTPFIIADKDTEDHHPLVSTIRVSDRWNSKTDDSNLTLAADIGESIDFRIGYTQEGDITWKVTDQTERENPSCSGATQTYSWSNPGTKYVACWLTNEENGTSNKTEWVVIMSTDVKGQVKEDSGDPLVSDITYYDTNGETVLRSAPSSSTFDFTAVPLYGYLEIDAFSTKNTSIRFCISGKSTNAVITINETKENPASFEFSEIPVKYIKAKPGSLAYNSSTITVRYSEDELDGVSKGALTIYRMWGSDWSPLDTQRDPKNNTLTAPIVGDPEWFMVGAPAGVGTCTQLKITTDKATYLLDPYYWVYETPDSLWPPDGYSRTVNFTVLLMDNRGYRAASDDVQYEVENATTVIASGDLADRGDGLYTASFDITDADSGGMNFNGSDPEYFTIRVEATTSDGVIDGSKSFRVGRW